MLNRTGHHVQVDFEPDKETDVYTLEYFLKPLYPKEVDPTILDKLKILDLHREKETEIEVSTRAGTASRKNSEREVFVEFLRKPEPSRDYFRTLQQWAGVVIVVGSDAFTCKLYDLTEDNPEEIAEIPLKDLMDDDFDLLRPGGVFYWSIGYHQTRSGQRIRESIIRFRRLPTWSKKEIDTARIESEAASRKLKWGVDVSGIDERVSG